MRIVLFQSRLGFTVIKIASFVGILMHLEHIYFSWESHSCWITTILHADRADADILETSRLDQHLNNILSCAPCHPCHRLVASATRRNYLDQIL